MSFKRRIYKEYLKDKRKMEEAMLEAYCQTKYNKSLKEVTEEKAKEILKGEKDESSKQIT